MNNDKERLEVIKEVYDIQAMQTFSDRETVPFNLNDIRWLVEQSERVQELEEELQELKKKLLTLTKENNQVNDELIDEFRQNKRYREALEFYAEQDNYGWEISYRPQQEIDCMVIDDGGHTARKALEESK